MRSHNPYLKAAVLEVVDNQLRDNDPPQTRQTYERLLATGLPESEVKRLLACVVVNEIFEVMKRRQAFDLGRFVAALDRLPKTPWED